MAAATPRRSLQLFDALAYAVVVTALSFLSGVLVSLPFGFDWYVVVAVMFLEGWLLFGIGTFKLRPTPPWKRNRGGVRGKVRESLSLGEESSTGPREDTPVEGLVYRVPGVGERVPHPNDRFSMGTKLFLASIVVLLSSFLLERTVIV